MKLIIGLARLAATIGILIFVLYVASLGKVLSS